MNDALMLYLQEQLFQVQLILKEKGFDSTANMINECRQELNFEKFCMDEFKTNNSNVIPFKR